MSPSFQNVQDKALVTIRSEKLSRQTFHAALRSQRTSNNTKPAKADGGKHIEGIDITQSGNLSEDAPVKATKTRCWSQRTVNWELNAKSLTNIDEVQAEQIALSRAAEATFHLGPVDRIS